MQIKKGKVELIGAFSLLIIGAIFMFYSILNSNYLVYYLTVKELNQNRSYYSGKKVKVVGKILDIKEEFTSIILGDEKEQLEVKYSGVFHSNIKKGIEVWVEGTYIENKLIAERIITKCPSKYKTKLRKTIKGGGE